MIYIFCLLTLPILKLEQTTNCLSWYINCFTFLFFFCFVDEPVLVFQRNSFLSLVDEEKQTNYCVISRLFEEVIFNQSNALKCRFNITWFFFNSMEWYIERSASRISREIWNEKSQHLIGEFLAELSHGIIKIFIFVDCKHIRVLKTQLRQGLSWRSETN